MEKLIRNIVDADKAARNRVNEKFQERDNVQNLILEKRDEIISKYQKEREVSHHFKPGERIRTV